MSPRTDAVDPAEGTAGNDTSEPDGQGDSELRDDLDPDDGSESSPDPSDDAARPRSLRVGSRRIGPEWAFPTVVLLLLVVLSALGVNGSSIGALTDLPGGGSSVLAGNPREVRSDEFYVRTPMVAGQAERGFPARTEIGVGRHDLTVLVDLPTRDWAMAFRPHQWAYGIAPIDQAYAFDWWGLSAVLLLGAYGFLLVLTRRWSWAALGAVVLWASPFFHWWYLALSLAVVGYGLGGAALLLASLRSGISNRARWGLVAAGAYVLCCFALTFYPPFQVPFALVLVCAAVGFVAQQHRQGDVELRTLATNLVVAGAVVGVVTALFFATRMDTLSRIMGTVYPGTRRVDGGDAPGGFIASAWLGLKYVQEPGEMRARVLPNESEASSFLLLGCFILPVLPLLWGRLVAVDVRLRGALVGSLAGMGLIAAHMYLGIPGILGTITLLDRVPPQRAIVGLGLASLLVAVIVGVLLDQARGSVSRGRRVLCAGATAAIAAGYVLTLASQYREAGAPVGMTSSMVAVVAVSAVAAVYFWRPLAGFAVLAVCGMAVSLSVNPLTRGLDTLTEAPLTEAVQRLDAASDDDAPAWLNTIDMSVPALAAAGVVDVSAVNLYPDHEAWLLIDPDSSEGQFWNRYAHTRWTLDPASDHPTFALLSNDTIAITIDPCGPELDRLEVGHVVSHIPLEASCLTKVEQSVALDGGPAYIYERSRRSQG